MIGAAPFGGSLGGYHRGLVADPQLALDDGATATGLPAEAVLGLPDRPPGVVTEPEVDSEEIVPIGELLDWAPADVERTIETRIGRLASLLGVAAVAVAVLILVFAAGTDIASMFRGLPGS